MRKDVKEAWVDALRSGKYRQTRETLADYQGHCCLGVLAEVLNKQFPEVYAETQTKFEKTGWEIRIYYNPGSYKAGGLPMSLVDKIGLSSQIQDKLSTRNDDGATFQEIAAYIQENL